MRYVVSMVGTTAWICGLVIAKGFWSTLAAVLIPLWSWYLVADAVLSAKGII